MLNKQSNTYTKRRKKRKGTESHATEAMTVFSLARARATSLFALAFALLCLFALSTFTVVHADDNLPKPAWQNACSSPFQVCSKVETYRFWGGRPSERLNFAVNGLINNPNDKNVLTVWLLMDDPDVEFAKELAKANFNVVMVYPRGTLLSTTHYTCQNEAPPHTDQCWLTAKCAAELSSRSAANHELFNVSHFSADQVAHDVEWLMRTLGDGRKNVVLTHGLSTVFATRMLQLHPDVPVGVIAMDYVHPVLFDSYGYLSGTGQDVALQHLLTLCDDDVACVGRLGAVEGSWGRLMTLMTLAKNKKLTCATKLEWKNKQWGSSFADQFRSVLALMLHYPTYPFLPSKTALTALIPSMMYRLQRCSNGDIQALNFLYGYVTSVKAFTCPKDVSVQMHWLLNEFTTAAPPNNVNKFWNEQTNQRLVLPAASNINAFHTAAKKFPTMQRTAAANVMPVNATQKILFISADVDPLAPRGAASRAAIGFQGFGGSVKALQIQGIYNQPASLLTPCIIANLKFYRSQNDWADADQCTLQNEKKLDFLKGQSKDFYGTGDAWDYDGPNSDDGSSRGAGGDESSIPSLIKRFFRALLILFLIAAVIAGGFYAYNYMRRRGFRFHRVNDNFYENLHV